MFDRVLKDSVATLSKRTRHARLGCSCKFKALTHSWCTCQYSLCLVTMFLYYKNVYVSIELIEWKSGVRSRTRMGPPTSVEPRQRTHKGQPGGYLAYYGHPSHLPLDGTPT